MAKKGEGDMTDRMKNEMVGIEPTVIGTTEVVEEPPEETQVLTQEVFRQAADMWLQMENGTYAEGWNPGVINKKEICRTLNISYRSAMHDPGWMNSMTWLEYIKNSRNFTVIESLDAHLAQQKAFDYIKNGLLRQMATHIAMDDLGMLAPWEKMHAKDKLTHLVKLSRYMSETKGEIAPAVGGDQNVNIMVNYLDRFESPEQRAAIIAQMKEEFGQRLIDSASEIVDAEEVPVKVRSKIDQKLNNYEEEEF